MAESNTTNSNDVQSRLAANERARQVLSQQANSTNGASAANATLNRLAENSRVRNQLRGKIEAIVDNQEVKPTKKAIVRRKTRFTKKLWIMIGTLALMAVLVVVAVTMLVQTNSSNSQTDEAPTASTEETVEEYMGLINSAMEEVDTREEKIMVFQIYIDDAPNNDVRVVLLNNKINYILSFDVDKEYGVYVIDTAIAIDNIEQTIDSARQVWNYASYYSNSCTMDNYQEIIDERKAESGEEMEENEETIG